MKMSKSAGEQHYVGVLEDESSIRKKVRSAVTDTGLEAGAAMSPGVENLFEILELSAEIAGDASIGSELRSEYDAGSLMYSRLKDETFEHLMAALRPIQERRAELEAAGNVVEILQDGARRAQAVADATIAEVREVVGLGTG